MADDTALTLEELQNLTQKLSGKLEELIYLQDNCDKFFLFISSLIIYIMQAGFAFLEIGLLRDKDPINIVLRNMLDSLIGAMVYWFFGWPLAFGGGQSNGFTGSGQSASADLADSDYILFFFHFTFAATATTIVSLAVAGRCNFYAYILYSVVITGIVYPIVSHWAWNGSGWLAKGLAFDNNGVQDSVSYQDFAGSGVIHVVGGMLSLAAAAILGPRKDRDQEDVKISEGASKPWASLGAIILYFGFFAFNGGSQASVSKKDDGIYFTRAVVNTILAGAFAGLTAMLINFFAILFATKRHEWCFLTLINGTLTGMVSICAGCNVMYPWGAAVTGIGAGIIVCFVHWLMFVIQVDDPLDCVAVHLGGGLWGVLAVILFDREAGMFMKKDKHASMALAWNVVGVLAIMAWSGLCGCIIFGFIRMVKCFRVEEFDISHGNQDFDKVKAPDSPSTSVETSKI